MTRVALKFGAQWCSMCDELEAEVLSQPAGRVLFEGIELRAVDFDAEPELVGRYAILELPTVVVVDPELGEVGRVVGFDDRDAWLREARTAVVSGDPVPTLRAQAESGQLEALLALGEALLSRQPEEGVAILERCAWSETDAAMHALWVLGRFHHRVRRDASTAKWIWQQLALRDPEGGHGALWWYAKAQTELGRVDLGSAAYAARVAEHPGDVSTLVEWSRFAGREGYEPAREAIRDAATRASKSARGRDRDALDDLVLELGRPF